MLNREIRDLMKLVGIVNKFEIGQQIKKINDPRLKMDIHAGLMSENTGNLLYKSHKKLSTIEA